MLKTARCCCHCPQSLHTYVGCMVKGCGCQHGVPCSEEELKIYRYPKSYIVDLPDRVLEDWKRDYPGADRSDLELEVKGNLSAIKWQQERQERVETKDSFILDMT